MAEQDVVRVLEGSWVVTKCSLDRLPKDAARILAPLTLCPTHAPGLENEKS